MGVGEMEQIIDETGVGEMGVGEMGVIRKHMVWRTAGCQNSRFAFGPIVHRFLLSSYFFCKLLLEIVFFIIIYFPFLFPAHEHWFTTNLEVV